MEIRAAKRLYFDPCEPNTQTNEIQPVKIRPVPCERSLNRAIFHDLETKTREQRNRNKTRTEI